MNRNSFSRQGDVYPIELSDEKFREEYLADAKPVALPDRSIAYGETSGHSHTLVRDKDGLGVDAKSFVTLSEMEGIRSFVKPDGTLVVEVLDDNVCLAHVRLGLSNYGKTHTGKEVLEKAEHKPVMLKRGGFYAFQIQRQYDPRTKQEVRSRD